MGVVLLNKVEWNLTLSSLQTIMIVLIVLPQRARNLNQKHPGCKKGMDKN